jgi:8-oxo-dGTP pyrophosphatase MutT (NUDIX family)
MLSPSRSSGKCVERFILTPLRRFPEEPSCGLARCHLIVHSAAMGNGAMGNGKLQLVQPRTGTLETAASRPRRRAQNREDREQVAAVCYRNRHAEIQFLLVRTRKGRWTFPKGGIQAGLTHAQAAALEAFEEAGVHGRIEEISFVRYTLRKRGGTQGPATEVSVHAHLCEVSRLGPAQEANRNPTWFSSDQAKQRLREDRPSAVGNEFARVVDRAVARIHRLRQTRGKAADALQKVQFEASEIAGIHARVEKATFVRYIRRQPGNTARVVVTGFGEAPAGKVVRLLPERSPDRSSS